MKYTQGTWTLPTCSKRMTDEEYEIAVGARKGKSDVDENVPSVPENTPEADA